jgi:trehalose synthase
LLSQLEQVGIQAIHTGPVKRAGSVKNMSYGPTIDGHFDRIELDVDPAFGNVDQYKQAVQAAREHGIAIIGDIIPGHTGMGPDFRLAERAVAGYPSLYAMSEIRPEDWALLPAVPDGEDSANLSQETALLLKEKGYILGPLDAVIFKRPGIKESNWSATPVVRGVDGGERRWVYLHLFKAGQPTLNWLDPSFAAARLVSADILQSLRVLGARGLRLDANMFLGFGPREGGGDGWLIEHPLSTVATELLATTIRKMGGFSFQELNASLDKIASTLTTGPELAYDFTTRPVYLYAVASGDAGPLRLMLRQLLASGVQPGRLAHALQNHDELMLEESELRVHGERVFEYEGTHEKGAALFERIHERAREGTWPCGSPRWAVLARVMPVVREIVLSHVEENVLVVSHKATLRLVLSSLLGFDARGYRDRLDQCPACLNVVDFKDPVRARLMLFNDVSHYQDQPRRARGALSKWWDVAG